MSTGWRRIPVPAMLLAAAPGMRAFQKEVEDGHLSVFAGREPDGFHLSISHRRNATLLPGRYPSWDEIMEARDLFTPPEVTMVQLLPPRSEWVNVHATTFHLWELPDGTYST